MCKLKHFYMFFSIKFSVSIELISGEFENNYDINVIFINNFYYILSDTYIYAS